MAWRGLVGGGGVGVGPQFDIPVLLERRRTHGVPSEGVSCNIIKSMILKMPAKIYPVPGLINDLEKKKKKGL